MLPKPLLLMLKKTKKKAKKIARAMTEPVQASSSSTAAVIDKLSSVLGHINPFDRAAAAAEPDKEKKSKGDESPVKTPDLIWLLDNTASSHRHPAPSDEARAPAPAPAEAEWIAEFTAAYFKTSTGEQLSTAVAEVSGAVGSASATETEEQKARVQWRIEERLAPFLNLIVREQACTLRVRGPGADSRHELAPSNHSGISVSELVLRGDYADGHVVAAEIVEPRCGKVLQGKTTFAAPTGWAVVSDIDDTIKKTLTRSSVGILQTTFVEEAECIAGMPELYKWVAEKLQRPVFWYLSASPYNLYPFLHDFRDANYPAGTLILRRSSWQNLLGFLSSLTQGTLEYKVEQLRKVHEDFPHRKLICVGDSTQTDPEAYAILYREAPGWIKGIFIRRVEDVVEVTDVVPGHGKDEVKRNSVERFEKAFEGVPKEAWHVYKDPKELYQKIEEVIARG